MKKQLITVLTSLLVTLTMSAQEEWLWPIQGKKAGSDIIYRPQDYIGQEHNFGDLFIHADEGTPVVCPADAVVSSCFLSASTSLSNGMAIGFEKSYEESVAEARGDVARRGISEQYISVCLMLKVGDKTLTITGLRMDQPLKTGSHISRGDVVGTVGYAYKAISEPHIQLNVSKQGLQDPMTPFGLKTTFKAPVAVQPKEVLTRAEAESDYRRLASSVREIYPSLTDLMTLEEYDAFVEQQISNLPEQISRKDFSKLMTLFNEKVHDSHLYIKKSVPQDRYLYPPLFYAMFEGKCRVTMAADEYKSYVGREIVKINGQPAAEVCAITRHSSNSYDAQVQSVHDYFSALWPCIDYAMATAPQKPGDKISFEFADGEQLETLLPDRISYDREHIMRWNAPARINQYPGQSYSARMLEGDTIFYIGLSHFNLSQVDTDSILWHIHQAEVNHTPYMIFDVRNNPGGNADVEDLLTRALMGNTPDRPHFSYQMANAAVFQSPITNYPEGDSIVTWLHPVEGKQGIYSERKENHYEPDPEGYNGRLYVLTDSRSASASAFLAGCIKRNQRGAVVGRETMSAYHVETCLKFAWIDLPNSQFGVNIPVIRNVIDETVNDRLPAGRGVIPDYNYPMTYEEYTYDGDYILDQALRLIRQGQYVDPLDDTPEPSSWTARLANWFARLWQKITRLWKHDNELQH